jgi:ATP-binding cassette subfamily B protein
LGAPSLITRLTNDVQQIQIVVVLVCTMAIGAPITMVVGIIMALREEVSLSIVLVFAVPTVGVVLGLIVSRMVPGFRATQTWLDRINQILREQTHFLLRFLREKTLGVGSPLDCPQAKVKN